MTLQNIINITDFDLSMMIIMENENGKKTAYDFANKTWATDSLFHKDKIVPVGRFAISNIYKKIRYNTFKTFSVLNTANIESLKGLETKRGVVILFLITDKDPKKNLRKPMSRAKKEKIAKNNSN